MNQDKLGTQTILFVAVPILLSVFALGMINQEISFSFNLVDLWMPLTVVAVLSVAAGVTAGAIHFVNILKPRESKYPTLTDDQYFSSLRLYFENRLTKGGLGRLLIELPMRLDKPKSDGSYSTTVSDIAKRYTRNDGSRRLAILGEPGSGKSVTLRRIGLELVQLHRKTNENMRMPYIPVYIDLSEPMDSYVPKDMIEHYIKKVGIGHRARVSQDNLLLLLDGLNEIPGKLSGKGSNTRNTRIGDLLSYLEHEFTGVFVLTSRVTDYAIYERMRKFQAEKIFIKSLSPAHIREISRRHFRDPQPFLDRLCSGDNLRARIELMKNLQALQMMIELFHDSNKGNRADDLSSSIFRLYENYVDYLYEQNGRRLAKSRKKVKRLKKEDLTHHLGLLARDMMLAGFYSCEIDWAQSRVRRTDGTGIKAVGFNNERLIWEGQNINLLVNSLEEDKANLKRDQDAKIKFAHQTLYEYFAQPHINLDKGKTEERITTVNRLGSMGTFARLKMVDLVNYYLDNRRNIEVEKATRNAIIKIALAYNAEAGAKLILLILIESLIRLYEMTDLDNRQSKIKNIQTDFEIVRKEQATANLINMIVDIRHKAIARTRGVDVSSDVHMFIIALLDPELYRSRRNDHDKYKADRDKSLIQELKKQYRQIFSNISHKLVDVRRKPFTSQENLAGVIVELFRIIWILENRIEEELTDIEFVLDKQTWIERRIERNAKRIKDEDDS